MFGYYDRVEGKILQVPLQRLHMTSGDHFSCQVTDRDGCAHSTPLHRIKEVRKYGQTLESS